MDKVIVITGASRGIGAATARLAGGRGYAVCVNYHANEPAASRVVADIEAAGGRAVAVKADMASEADVIRLFETADRELGPITALVNNAGILQPRSKVADMDGARLAHILAVNVTGYFLCAREAVKRMSSAGGGAGGAIVNLSSAASRLGAPFEYVDYAASKGAVDTFTIGLAREVAELGIRVNAVRPGIIDTDIHASGGDPDRAERVKDNIPMKRAGTAAEVAAAILWLLSDEASYTSGVILDVTGGR